MNTYAAYRIELKHGDLMHYKTGRLQDIDEAIRFNNTWVGSDSPIQRVALLSQNPATASMKLVTPENPE